MTDMPATGHDPGLVHIFIVYACKVSFSQAAAFQDFSSPKFCMCILGLS
jgi:hypothetical protein